MKIFIFIQTQKGTISSNSFSYERKPLNRQQETIYEDEATSSYQTSKYQSPIKSRLTVNPSDDNNSVTLTHTVSFYRRQQTQNSPSVRKIFHSEEASATTDDNTDFDYEEEKGVQSNHYSPSSQEDLVDKKIKSLMKKVMVENQQIAQASNALTTCASTFEFSGSTESVVAEWKLLVASKFECGQYLSCNTLVKIYANRRSVKLLFYYHAPFYAKNEVHTLKVKH